MRFPLQSTAAALALLLAACGRSAGSGGSSAGLGDLRADAGGERARQVVQVDVTGKAVRIRNMTRETIGYAVFEADLLFVAIMPPCTEFDACESLEPNETVEVPYEEIGGDHGDAADARVDAWNYVTDPQYATRAERLSRTRVKS